MDMGRLLCGLNRGPGTWGRIVKCCSPSTMLQVDVEFVDRRCGLVAFQTGDLAMPPADCLYTRVTEMYTETSFCNHAHEPGIGTAARD